MPHLHTLVCWHPHNEQILSLSNAGAFPALRRAFIHCADLTGEQAEALARWQAPKLMELSILGSKRADVRVLAASPLFDRLRMLSLNMHSEDQVDALAASACAHELRLLSIHGDGDRTGSFRSLATTALTRTGAFPSLTTLELECPFSDKAKRDTAAFLKKLATPALRHLLLDSCDFDDECADIVGNSPTFRNLTRLHIENGPLSTKATEMFFRSPNLQNIVELGIRSWQDQARKALGKAVPVLLDKSIMPKLVRARFSTEGVAKKVSEELKSRRPEIV